MNTTSPSGSTSSEDAQNAQASKHGRGGTWLVILLIAIAAGAWFGHQQLVVIPTKQQAELEAKQERERLAKIAAEQERQRLLEIQRKQEEKKRLAELERQRKIEQERLRKEREEQERMARLATIARAKEKKRLKRIEQAKASFQHALKHKHWTQASQALELLESNQFPAAQLVPLNTKLHRARERHQRISFQVDILLDQANAHNFGPDKLATIHLLDRLLLLDPEHKEAIAMRAHLLSRPSTYSIPQDARNLADLTQRFPLQPGDTIHFSPGTYKLSEAGIFQKNVHIIGAGHDQTILECDTTKHPGLAFVGAESPSTLSQLTLRGTNYEDAKAERFPLVLAKADLTVSHCNIQRSSSHGIAVLGGRAILRHLEITENAWDGISITGATARAEIAHCQVYQNYDHGIDFWNQAQGSIKSCEVYQNAGSGIVITGHDTKATITQVRSYENEHSGIAILQQGQAKLARVVAAKNQLSGVAIHHEGTSASLGMVISNHNGEAGFHIDPTSNVEGINNITAEGNKAGRITRKAPATEPQTDSDMNPEKPPAPLSE